MVIQTQGILLPPAQLEEELRIGLEQSTDLSADAPGEIADDLDTVLSGFEDLVDALADIGYDPTNNIEVFASDPRVAAFESPTYAAAIEAIDAYCGNGLSERLTASTDGSVGRGFTFDGVADNFPDELVPPGVSSAESINVQGAYSVVFMTDASFDDVVAFYTNAVGPPGSLDVATVKSAEWIPAGGTSAIIVQETDGVVTAAVVGSD